MLNEINIGGRKISIREKPFIIPEIGINHEGDINKAKEMILSAYHSGAECVKFQCHVIDDEMIPNQVVPGNSNETIWDIMNRCALGENEERELKKFTEDLGLIYLSTPFSRAAADRLEKMDVVAYKIGSGECNNLPLLKHIASFGKPVILSTGMNDIESVSESVKVLRDSDIEFALLHVTSLYPTPYSKVRLGALEELAQVFPDAVIGLSDHSIGNYTCYAAIAMNASIVEKHFTVNKTWPGPDIPISIDSGELKELIRGCTAIHEALGGSKTILPEEQPTISFAYASVVSIKDIKKGDILTRENIWVKRPGTGEIHAKYFEGLLNHRAKRDIKKDIQLKRDMIES